MSQIQELIRHGFHFLMVWERVLLLDVLIVQCQDRLELLRPTYPHPLQNFQVVILGHFSDRQENFIPSRVESLDIIPL